MKDNWCKILYIYNVYDFRLVPWKAITCLSIPMYTDAPCSPVTNITRNSLSTLRYVYCMHNQSLYKRSSGYICTWEKWWKGQSTESLQIIIYIMKIYTHHWRLFWLWNWFANRLDTCVCVCVCARACVCHSERVLTS